MKKFNIYFLLFFLVFSFSFHFESKKAYSEELASQQTIENIDTGEFLSLINENKGKLILVNFFASWCPPCVKEVPDFVKITKEYSADEILIIGLSVDVDKESLQRFIKEQNVNYPVYYASKELAASYKVMAIPRNIIYDKKLKQVYNEIGIITYKQLEDMLKSS